jgi:hypothetical protein
VCRDGEGGSGQEKAKIVWRMCDDGAEELGGVWTLARRGASARTVPAMAQAGAGLSASQGGLAGRNSRASARHCTECAQILSHSPPSHPNHHNDLVVLFPQRMMMMHGRIITLISLVSPIYHISS